MKLSTNDILKKLLLPMSDDWDIVDVKYDEPDSEIHVYLKYNKDTVTLDGQQYKIWDLRPERIWRHLDMWQCKTVIHAQIPRYRKDNAQPLSIDVPWAEATMRVTDLLKKK